MLSPLLVAKSKSSDLCVLPAIDGSLVAGHYEKAVDRDSAYEQLKARAGQKTAKSAARAMGSEVGRSIIRGVLGSILGGRR